jgi:hypothetical protein
MPERKSAPLDLSIEEIAFLIAAMTIAITIESGDLPGPQKVAMGRAAMQGLGPEGISKLLERLQTAGQGIAPIADQTTPSDKVS